MLSWRKEKIVPKLYTRINWKWWNQICIPIPGAIIVYKHVATASIPKNTKPRNNQHWYHVGDDYHHPSLYPRKTQGESHDSRQPRCNLHVQYSNQY